MINVFILCDLFEHFRKIMQQTEKEVLTLIEQVATLLKILEVGNAIIVKQINKSNLFLMTALF